MLRSRDAGERPVRSRTIRRVYLLTSVGALLWLGAIFAAPVLAGQGHGGAAGFFYAVFSPVCHQIPERCFALHGYPLAVCGRCLGIYAGFVAGLVLYPFVRGFSKLSLPPGRIILLLALPMVVDAGAGILGVWKSPLGARFLTGAVWGTALPFYFVTGAADFLFARRERREGRRGPELENPQAKSIE